MHSSSARPVAAPDEPVQVLRLTGWGGWAAAAAATALGRLVAAPAEVLRVALQTGPQPVGSLRASAARLYRREGMRGFWKGALPGAASLVVQGAVRFTAYDAATARCRTITSAQDAQHSLFPEACEVGSALLVGVAAAFAAHPLDSLAVRLALLSPVDATARRYEGMWTIGRRAGFRQVLAGCPLACFGQLLHDMILFSAFAAAGRLVSRSWLERTGPAGAVVFGAAVSVAARVALTPLEVLKTRQQAAGTSLRAVAAGLWEERCRLGRTVLFAGASTHALRAAPLAAAQIGLYEVVRQAAHAIALDRARIARQRLASASSRRNATGVSGGSISKGS
jgi:hypothetical protein